MYTSAAKSSPSPPARPAQNNFRSLAYPPQPPYAIPLYATDAASAISPMFSSGRPCLRRRLSVVLDTSAVGPDEPLLFLYPRWAASALQRQQIASLTTKTISTNRNRPSDRSLAPAGPSPSSSLLFSRQSSRWLSSDATANAAGTAGSSSEVPVAGRETIGPNGKKDIKERVGFSGHHQTSPVTEPKRPLNAFTNIELTDPVRTPVSWRNKNRNLNRSRSRPLATPTRDLTSRKAEFTSKLSVRDRKKLRYGTFIKDRSGSAEKLSHTTVGGWDSMKDILERQERDPRTAVRRSLRQKELQVPEETIALISGMTDTARSENIFYIHVRNGCRVHIMHPREGDGIHRKVILSGSERVMELVEDRIKRSQTLQKNGDPLVEVSKPIFPVFSSIEAMRRNNLPVPMIRGVWHDSRPEPMSLRDLLEYRSSTGTVKEFAESIEDLTHAWESKSGEKKKNGAWVVHRDMIVRRIWELFRQDSNREFFSSAALNQALAFLCGQEHLRTARAVFLRAEHVATADSYNIFLRSAARRQDLKTFRRFLVSMNRAHIRPNKATWLALLEAMITPNAKASLVAHLVQKGYIAGTSTTRTALQLTIQDSLLVHLDNGQSMDSFIALIAQTNGANWFTPSLISQMFSVIARRKDFTASNILLKFCSNNQLQLKSDTVTTLVSMCRKDIFSAIDYTLPLLRQQNFRLSRDTLESLFRVAYKSEKYNICRVLWRYACLDGNVTYRMKEMVLSSLRRNVPLKKYSNDIHRIWQLNAGKVIIGLDLHLPRQKGYPTEITDLLPSKFHGDPLGYLTSGFKPQGEERDLQNRVAYMLIKHDIQSGAQHYHSQFPLSVMLEAAAILDTQWKGIPMPLSYMLENAIQVPVRRRSPKKAIDTRPKPLSSTCDSISLYLYSTTSALHAK